MAANPDLCSVLEWDSAFFGMKIARANLHRLEAQSADRIVEWCRENSVRCLYLLADSDHLETLRLAERHGFYLTDVRVTYEHTLKGPVPAGPGIRPALPEDLPGLREMSASSYVDTRFYYDGHFSQEQCSRLYITWIEKSMDGQYAQAVLVTGAPGQPEGFVTCHIDPGSRGRIGLVGVGAGTRGRGVGQSLVAGALAWFGERGVKPVEVTTQGRNVAAQRLYQRCGFLTREVKLWYHRWFPETT